MSYGMYFAIMIPAFPNYCIRISVRLDVPGIK
jgi:hypothetical protein